MKHTIKVACCLLAVIILAGSCSKKDNTKIDTEYPVINISVANAFPQQCSIVKRGESFTFRALLTDNVQLGSVSVDIHNNFDQHSHSTEVSTCQADAKKTPVKPFLFINSYPISAGLNRYEVNQTISVPADVDVGDYHFLIRLTDKEGWQTIKGLSIKIQ